MSLKLFPCRLLQVKLACVNFYPLIAELHISCLSLYIYCLVTLTLTKVSIYLFVCLTNNFNSID